MKIYVILILSTIWAFSCSEKPKTAQEILSKSIEAYGGKKVYQSEIEFDFREIHYKGFYDQGKYSWERIFEDDSLGSVHDILNNDGFTRYVNDQPVELDEEWTGKYSRSVNSVLYFFRIPFNLNDPAANLTLLGESEINGEQYYKLGVSFDEEGGGEDYDDSFVYWIGKEDYLIDYLAYSYSTDGGGKRFREMINLRAVNGLKVVDYINYKPKDLSIAIEDYDKYFQDGGMEELSRIINENVEIKYLQ